MRISHHGTVQLLVTLRNDMRDAAHWSCWDENGDNDGSTPNSNQIEEWANTIIEIVALFRLARRTHRKGNAHVA